MHLLAITAELRVFEGEIHWDQPFKLGIEISGRPFIQMWQQRGDSVRFDDQPLEPEDFGEVGRVEIHDITDRLDPGLRNERVGNARIIQAGETEPIGLALPRSGRTSFCLWINGDELRWGNQAALDAENFPEGKKAAIGAFLCRDIH
jgi:hypothetical protein